eukprot:TRINITY_DN1060_c0_g1_i1.p1 TRINITY_DN1060_c0_g1~~TRINITY_DN1060_c0_g1_i1.p1  ORF type:complete len:675 (-),score=59.97 TRINITY_DN1060_c0_g1_i1:336-2360(-)
MLSKILVVYLALLMKHVASDHVDFKYNGFSNANMRVDGIAEITPSGLLRLTKAPENENYEKGHAFYRDPINLKNSSNGNVLSFSTTFVFAIAPRYPIIGMPGMAFVLSPSKDLHGAQAGRYLGLLNSSNNGNVSNHIIAIELDITISSEFGDINDNHVGIDINSLRSVNASMVSYYAKEKGGFKNLSLISGEPMQVWVEYNGVDQKLDVTLSPINVPKPSFPLLSSKVNISMVVADQMYAGFSSSAGQFATFHYVLGWSFKSNGQAQALNLSSLPRLPRIGPKKKPKNLTIGLPLILTALALTAISCTVYIVSRRIKFAEILEDWELQYGLHRFSYKDLFVATKGFRDQALLGSGGFGRVYKGVLPNSKTEVAVKKISHESTKDMREFIAEIVSISKLRHRNLVPFLGYCRRKGELLLVSEFMPNGSLDKLLFDQPKSILNWSQRFQTIKGVASGLFYLHEGWEQLIIHKDVKVSNVLLDSKMNGRLGDFGLPRLYDQGTDPRGNRVVGTLGYIAPELAKTGKETRSTDVFAFGTILLEVACGRRPIERRASANELVLVDWVLQCWRKGLILQTRDPNLETAGYVVEEMELVLKLGLLCSHPVSAARPSMRQVIQFLEGRVAVPELELQRFSDSVLAGGNDDGFDDFVMSYPSSVNKDFSQFPSAVDSLLSRGS